MKCDHCGKEIARIETHHSIPYWFSDSSDTMEVCSSCHKHLEKMFERFVKYGSLKKPQYSRRNLEKDRRFQRSYRKKFLRFKGLFSICPVPGVQYKDYLRLNKKTGTMTVSHCWGWTHRS